MASLHGFGEREIDSLSQAAPGGFLGLRVSLRRQNLSAHLAREEFLRPASLPAPRAANAEVEPWQEAKRALPAR